MEKRETKYGIGELAALTGVTRRTIRFYVQKGLLPRPLGLGRGKHYTEEHLERILRIRALQKEGVPLDRMGEVLEGGAEKPLEELERRLVTRVRLAKGVWLEFSHGGEMPPPGKLMRLAQYCRNFLAVPNGDK